MSQNGDQGGARVCVVLAGCGYLDGAEITEAVSTLVHLSRAGAQVSCFAPDMTLDEVDHIRGEPTGQTRNVLAESARIARGAVSPLSQANASDYDAIVLPGGFGAAKNLCSFATDGPGCSVDPDLAQLLKEAHTAGKPMGFICIAPAIAAKVFGVHEAPLLTIGSDASTAHALQAMGAVHQDADATGIVVDAKNRVVSTAAYMYDSSPAQVFDGVGKLVGKVLELAAVSA